MLLLCVTVCVAAVVPVLMSKAVVVKRYCHNHILQDVHW